MTFELCMDALCQAAVEDSPREPDVRRVPAEILRQLKTDPRGASLPEDLDVALEELLEARAKLAAFKEAIRGTSAAYKQQQSTTWRDLVGAVQRLSDPRANRETVPEDIGERVWDGDAIELGRETSEPARPLARVSCEHNSSHSLYYVWLDVSVDTTPKVAQALTYDEAADLANKINARGAEQKVKP